MIFWNLSTVKLLIVVFIKFLEFCDVQSIEGYPAEIFFPVEVLEKMEVGVFKIMLKSCMVAMATYLTADWFVPKFSEWKITRKKIREAELESPSRFKGIL